MTRTIHYCNFCDYKSDRRYDRDKHVSRKHANDHSTPSQAGSGAVQSVQPHSEDHSNLQEESVDQLYENIFFLLNQKKTWLDQLFTFTKVVRLSIYITTSQHNEKLFCYSTS